MRPAVGAEQTLGLFLLQPLLFELVVTPGALACVNLEPATGNSATWQQMRWQSARGHPVAVSSAHPPGAQQGPVLRANVVRAKGEVGGRASVPHTDQGSSIRAQSREAAAYVMSISVLSNGLWPGLGPGGARPGEFCWVAWEQSAVALPWLPGIQFHK